MASGNQDNHWSLDKRVPIAIIVTIVVQLAGFVWYAAKQDARLGILELEATRHDGRLQSLEANRLQLSDRVIRLEEHLRATYDAVKRIEGKLDTIVQSRRSDRGETP